MQLFFEPNILTQASLGHEESHHAIQVLRHRQGDIINIVDGKGSWVKALINKIDKKICTLSVQSVVENYKKPGHHIHIAIAPTKNLERIEWFVEKATEIGVQEISFVQCQKSERKELKNSRLYKAAVAAMKQSKQAYLPKINEITTLKELLKQDFSAMDKFVAAVDFDNIIYLQDTQLKTTNSLVLIGPEGDFANQELETLVKSGFCKVSLGSTVLRTETAGIVAVNILNNKYLISLWES
jgi:16S rRNA (uracil1498-N3)-methyltransferase